MNQVKPKKFVLTTALSVIVVLEAGLILASMTL